MMIHEIIELLPSADLKAKIKETNHSFQENELLQIIYKYAPTLDARIDLLERFSRICSSDISLLAKAYIQYEQESFSRFLDASGGFIYELCIKETPDSYEETYVCSSYQAALVCIDRFYETYASINTKETEKTRYKIVKRKVFSENDRFDEDTYGECVLGPGKIVKKTFLYNNPADCQLDIMCDECQKICPYRCDKINFPCFAHNYAIIKYQDHEGKERFGVNICLESCDGSELYIVHLDASEIREHRFDAGFLDHEHLEPPLATLATPDDLDEIRRRNYFDFVAYLESLET